MNRRRILLRFSLFVAVPLLAALAVACGGDSDNATESASASATPAEAVAQAFDQVNQSLGQHGMGLERVIDVEVVSATRDERDW